MHDSSFTWSGPSLPSLEDCDCADSHAECTQTILACSFEGSLCSFDQYSTGWARTNGSALAAAGTAHILCTTTHQGSGSSFLLIRRGGDGGDPPWLNIARPWNYRPLAGEPGVDCCPIGSIGWLSPPRGVSAHSPRPRLVLVVSQGRLGWAASICAQMCIMGACSSPEQLDYTPRIFACSRDGRPGERQHAASVRGRRLPANQRQWLGGTLDLGLIS